MTTPLFDEALLAGSRLPAERRLMEISLGKGTVGRVLEANMVGDIDSPLATEMHVALHHPVRSEHRGLATMLTIAAPPPAWGVLERWGMGRANRIRQGSTQGARAEARLMARLAIRIRRELDRLAAHPAYRGEIVAGVEPLILPAYRVVIDPSEEMDEDYGPLAPTPDLAIKAAGWAAGDIEVGEMLPFAVEQGGQVYTTWIWHSAPGTTTHPD